MASNIRIPTALMAVFVFASCQTEAFIGMNWGRQNAQRLLPSQVVDLMLQNGIRNARIFTSQEDIMQAFSGSGIDLTITVYDINYGTFRNASQWFKAKANLILASNVRTLILGGVPHIFDVNANMTRVDAAMAAFRSSQRTFDETGNGHIKVTTTVPTTVLKPVIRPSDCEFIDQMKPKMAEFLDFLRGNKAPFLLDMFPILDAERSNFSSSFALPTGAPSDVVVKDINGAVYTNVFEWQYDCLVWALRKLNASDIKVVVSQVGWPTDGYNGATADNAERFFKYLLPLVSSKKGTPMRPGAPIDVFVHELTDEPKMVPKRPVDRHWGVYRSNGEAKFKIDLWGQGRDIFPTTVKGIMRMPNRWCLFNGHMEDVQKVINQTNFACKQGDCTTLAPGASCSNLDFVKNVSYAFNVYFQTHFQDEKACNFEGLGYVSEHDPSTEECVFPVEVVKGQQVDFYPSAGRQNCRVGLVLLLSALAASMWV